MTGVIENFHHDSDITVGGVTVNVTGSTAISGDLKDGDVATIYFYSGGYGIPTMQHLSFTRHTVRRCSILS